MTVIVAICSAFGALFGGLAAFVGVVRHHRKEHTDSSCAQAKRALENFHDGILIANRELTIVFANKQARAITGYGVDLVGKSIYDLIPERFRDRHREHVQRFFNDPHTRKMGVLPMELWLIDRFGIEKRMRLSLSPSENEYGGIETTVGMQVDQ